MLSKKALSINRVASTILSITLFMVASHAVAQHETVLYNFNSDATDGILPFGGLVFDNVGNLYGTTGSGAGTGCDGGLGCGEVFELSLQGGVWTKTVLHNFNDSAGDGGESKGTLAFDSSGNLYGTTEAGGSDDRGTVFELMPQSDGTWKEKILYNFTFNDGCSPVAGVIVDAAGHLFGTTYACGAFNKGTVFELSHNTAGHWLLKTLHSFGNGTDGQNPYGGVILDAAGNLYGATASGGRGAIPEGTVFELMRQAAGGWKEKLLANFSYYTTGPQVPYGGLTFDASGNLYGTSYFGGTDGQGTVFELIPKASGGWTPKVLANLSGDASSPLAGISLDSSGSIYGTAAYGGSGYGAVFKLTRLAGGAWTESILYTFTNQNFNGEYPQAGVILDPSGNVYGTTTTGGVNLGGTVFEITP
jgi:uncharacterized repeat protein (TIGR03803 family)